MIVSVIAAIASNGVIGKDNDLVWDLPDDMAFFKQKTKDHHVIMGRRNYESIPHKFRPLPGRPNVIVTHRADYDAPGCTVTGSVEDAIEIARAAGETEAFIIGGGQIYAETLRKDLADRLYLTHLAAPFEGDTYFPKFGITGWQVQHLADHPADSRHACSFIIKQYDRIR
jgi:dihydrofolate reductase